MAQQTQSQNPRKAGLNFILFEDKQRDTQDIATKKELARKELEEALKNYGSHFSQKNSPLPTYIEFFKAMFESVPKNRESKATPLGRPFDKEQTPLDLRPKRTQVLSEMVAEFQDNLKALKIDNENFSYTDKIMSQSGEIMRALSHVLNIQNELNTFFNWAEKSGQHPDFTKMINKELKKDIIFNLQKGLLNNLASTLFDSKILSLSSFVKSCCTAVLQGEIDLKKTIMEDLLTRYKNAVVNASSSTDDSERNEARANEAIKILNEELPKNSNFMLMEKEDKRKFINNFIRFLQKEIPYNKILPYSKRLEKNIQRFIERFNEDSYDYTLKTKNIVASLRQSLPTSQFQKDLKILKNFVSGFDAEEKPPERVKYAQNVLDQVKELDANLIVEILFMQDEKPDPDFERAPIFRLFNVENLPENVKEALSSIKATVMQMLSDEPQLQGEKLKEYIDALRKDYLRNPPKYKVSQSTKLKNAKEKFFGKSRKSKVDQSSNSSHNSIIEDNSSTEEASVTETETEIEEDQKKSSGKPFDKSSIKPAPITSLTPGSTSSTTKALSVLKTTSTDNATKNKPGIQPLPLLKINKNQQNIVKISSTTLSPSSQASRNKIGTDTVKIETRNWGLGTFNPEDLKNTLKTALKTIDEGNNPTINNCFDKLSNFLLLIKIRFSNALQDLPKDSNSNLQTIYNTLLSNFQEFIELENCINKKEIFLKLLSPQFFQDFELLANACLRKGEESKKLGVELTRHLQELCNAVLPSFPVEFNDPSLKAAILQECNDNNIHYALSDTKTSEKDKAPLSLMFTSENKHADVPKPDSRDKKDDDDNIKGSNSVTLTSTLSSTSQKQ